MSEANKCNHLGICSECGRCAFCLVEARATTDALKAELARVRLNLDGTKAALQAVHWIASPPPQQPAPALDESYEYACSMCGDDDPTTAKTRMRNPGGRARPWLCYSCRAGEQPARERMHDRGRDANRTNECRPGAWGSPDRCVTHAALPIVNGRCAWGPLPTSTPQQPVADRMCVCGHPKSAHARVDGTLKCGVSGCACGPGCIHEGFVAADGTMLSDELPVPRAPVVGERKHSEDCGIYYGSPEKGGPYPCSCGVTPSTPTEAKPAWMNAGINLNPQHYETYAPVPHPPPTEKGEWAPEEWPPSTVALYCDAMRTPPVGLAMNGDAPISYTRTDLHDEAEDHLRAVIAAWNNCYGMSGAVRAATEWLDARRQGKAR